MDVNRLSSMFPAGSLDQFAKPLVPSSILPPPKPGPDPVASFLNYVRPQNVSDSGSGSFNRTTSLGNTGNEKLPSDLSTLGNIDWNKGTTLAEFEWHALRILDFNYHDSGDWGSFSANGYTDFGKIRGRVYGDAGFDDGTAHVGGGVQGQVSIVDSHYDAEYKSPSLYNLGGHDIYSDTTFGADAQVGVNGFAEGDLGIGKNTHLNVGAGGFDGASASIEGSQSLGDYASVYGDAKAWAGVGAKVDVDAGLDDGKLSFHFGAGLALGIGGEYDWGFTIDFGAIGDSVVDVAGDALDAVGDAAGDAVDAAGDAAGDAVDAIGDAAGDVADAAGDAADAVGDAISDVFDW